MSKKLVLLLLFSLIQSFGFSQIVPVGSGSYTTTFPGVDEAGRNGFPSGTPQLVGLAATKPVPTNDWWSLLLKDDHANNLFNYPMALATVNEGLVVSYIVPVSGANGSSQPSDGQEPIVVGVSNLNASRANISDFSDWMVTLDWNDGSEEFEATTGIGMPFIYFSKASDDVASVRVDEGTVQVLDEILVITNSHQGADFAVYAPDGSTWTQNGTTYTSTLNGKNYWSMAFIPETASSVMDGVTLYQNSAYVFPTNTEVAWEYDENTSNLSTTFTVETEIKEGSGTDVILGLLPHQWSNLSASSAQPSSYTFSSIRGKVKTLIGNTFIVENTFKGILPTLPYLTNYSDGFNPAELDEKVALIENDALATWTDSYNEGQMMNRMIQTARIADQMGNIEALEKMVATIKGRLEDWLTAEAGEVAFLFYYNADWSALIGYPAGHGQDGNLNDHHFHWGYFIHAAAFMEQFEPGWSDSWGDMINLLVRDAASTDREDDTFPFLRNFSPYAGHSWANGFATFPFGNDQESSSESMQFAASLIHWGSAIGDDEIRDLGIYIYTTEQTAAEEYWFDIYERNFKPGYGYSLASRVWGNGYDNQTFFTGDIAAAYGIEMYPIHAGSLYLGHNTDYVEKLWTEISSNTGILSNEENPNLWHDMMWKYLSFIDPQVAIDLYNSYPDRSLKFGISDAQTYHWLHAMNAIGQVNSDITADYPVAAVFTKDGANTYVANNYGDTQITVVFSDDFQLIVPANQMATNRDVDVSGTLSSDFYQAYPGGKVNLSLEAIGGVISKIEFYDGDEFIGETTEEPYQFSATNLSLGVHSIYSRIYVGDDFNVSNIVSIQVGEQVSFSGAAIDVPGSFEAGNYDAFEGGVGQEISYLDFSQFNEGGYRPTEYVDAALEDQEGATVGWISEGEWMEYTIDVAQAGNYNLSYRYASGNTAGGGPFHFEIDGNVVSSDIATPNTGDWGNWVTGSASNIELNEGLQVLRLVADNGEFNIGELSFTFGSDLSYGAPIANAGSNVVVIFPATTANLDGSGSSDPDQDNLTYSWQQVYGPSPISFSDNTIESPSISNLELGVYKCKLTVSDGDYESSSSVLVIVSESGNSNPSISITSPEEGSSFEQGSTILITTNSNDLEGEITLVEFYDAEVKIGEDMSEPFEFSWTSPDVGSHALTAKATDEQDATGASEIVNVSVVEVASCSETSSESSEGSFSVGYIATFESIGESSIRFTFELLDTDKNGVVAFLFLQNPFSETQMDHVEGNTFTKTLNGITPGTTQGYACKFAFAGGLSVTKYISYQVGTNCEEPEDTQAPTNVTVSAGAITQSSIELNLSADDNSGGLDFEISYGQITSNVSAQSGQSVDFLANSLDHSTTYVFEIIASDASGNDSGTEQISLSTLTAEGSVLSIEDYNLVVFPNPTDDLLTIETNGHLVEIDEIIDLEGKVYELLITKGTSMIVLDMEPLATGIYLIKLKADGKDYVMRTMKN